MKLLEEYKTLDNILAHIDKLSPKLQSLIGDGKTAKHSQFLATIRTDVPYDIDVIDMARQSNAIHYSPELVAFLRKYEFKSLLPHTDIPENTVYVPKKSAITARGETLSTLWEKIQHDTPYSLAINGHPMMTACAIALNEEEIYDIDLHDRESRTLIRNILDTPHEMMTYNWKENARAMLWWLTYS